MSGIRCSLGMKEQKCNACQFRRGQITRTLTGFDCPYRGGLCQIWPKVYAHFYI